MFRLTNCGGKGSGLVASQDTVQPSSQGIGTQTQLLNLELSFGTSSEGTLVVSSQDPCLDV